MLRQRAKGKESDRFITARSVEREKNIEKYNINEDNKQRDGSVKNEFNLCEYPNSEKKTRTPSIVVDENQYSRKLYLSLLKTQIFNSEGKLSSNNENTSESSCLSKKKQKHSNYLSKVSGDKNESTGKISRFTELDEICKKIDFSDYKIKNKEKYCSNLKTVNQLDLFENMELKNENSKSSFKNLINFEIEDQEYTKNFLRQKKIPKSPFKVLDAPCLRDDFYLHLLDWSDKDRLAVGLERSLYLYESKNSNVNLLTTFDEEQVTSVKWMNDANLLLIGSGSGRVNLWDIEKSKCVTTYHNHSERVGVIAKMNTNNNCFTSGSQDRIMYNYDIRVDPNQNGFQKLIGHTQEICGLKWSLDDRMLASGGNDNKLFIWNANKMMPEKKINAHTSAVKAIDWSPFKYGTLISGGGTQDRTIKIWNTNTMKLVESIDTSSQVCNIAFSKHTREFVTTHGYSDNLILIWDADTLDVKATLKGHSERVIYLSTGPDPQKIVTGAGDETIRFWDVFLSDKTNSNNSLSELYSSNKSNNYCSTPTSTNLESQVFFR